ncbi:MAG: 2-phosphosulfolactate phosphatase [Methanobacterium formicicum]|uniref:2-phosphosulfolactate phosphatase n=1 Tax=Methanobacterium formicicum TaxID=2162 RepID=UPI002492AF67|nr:2-phosphosulfolactate phosphatase [Methanobacterium formicicum]MDD4810840.1 2-phosphosulfolactate phosphatase [Methanobacterium formicicum]
MQVSLSFERSLSKDVAIMVDVLRASTTITVALEKIPNIIPTLEIEEALALAPEHQAFLAGERGGATIEGFDVGNSPLEIQELEGETLIITTSNGTRILEGIRGRAMIGSFINARAVANKALQVATDHVEVVMAGVRGNFAIEDFLGAGEIISHLQDEELDEMAQAACLAIENQEKADQAVKGSRSAQNLKKLGFGKDVEFCLQRDKSQLVPEFKDGLIRILE